MSERIEIEAKGAPPWQDWNDTEDRVIHGVLFSPQHGHETNSYLEALKAVFSLTDGGRKTGPRVACIRDSKGEIVFGVTEEDKAFLLEIDKVGLANITVIESGEI